jgi:hypothetical protein
MTLRCSHAPEIAEALKTGRWPQGCDPELRTHTDGCRSCSDLVLVTQTFQQARSESVLVPHLDSPSLLWWRAQLRRRNAAVRRVSQPITVAQTFAVAVNLLVAAGFVAVQSRRGIDWRGVWSGLARSRAFHLDALWSFASMKLDWTFMLLIPSLGVLALLSGVAVYLASDRH